MEDDRLIDCGGMIGGGGGEAFVTFNPRRPFNFYWNNNCIILPKSVDLPQVSPSNNNYISKLPMHLSRPCKKYLEHSP